MLERMVVLVGRARFLRTAARAIPAAALGGALIVAPDPPYEGDVIIDRPAGDYVDGTSAVLCEVLRALGLPCPEDPEPVEEPPVPPLEPFQPVIEI